MNLREMFSVIRPGCSLKEQEASIRNSRMVARWVSASLRFGAPVGRKQAVFDAWSALECEEGTPGWEIGVIELEEAEFGPAVLREASHLGSDLLVLGLARPGAGQLPLPAWLRHVLERSELPMLLLPEGQKLGRVPFRSLLVPLSGERGLSAALVLALQLAVRCEVPVDLVHVSCVGGEGTSPSIMSSAGDQFQHEYPQLIEQFIAQSCPYATPRQRLMIREFYHRCGEPAAEVLKHLQEGQSGLLVVEWKSTLAQGRASMIKRILRLGNVPVLLVREAAEASTRLKVRDRFEAA